MKKSIPFRPLIAVISCSLFSSCSEVDKQLEKSANRDLEAEIQAIEDKKTTLTPEERALLEKHNKKLLADINAKEKARLAKIDAEELEKRKIEEENAMQAEQARLEELAKQKAEEAKLQKQLAVVKAKQDAQKKAWKSYIGTKYDELELKTGTVLKQATATEVRATHVTFSHQAGIANVKFTDLSYKIKQLCKYDPELARIAKTKQDELQKRIRTRLEQSRKAEAVKPKASAHNKPKNGSHQRPTVSSSASKLQKEAVVPKGSVRVKVIGVDHVGYRHSDTERRYHGDGTRKKILIQAWANVKASIRVSNGLSYTVYPGVPFKREVTLDGSKYTVSLRDSKGRLLGEARHNRKKGL